MTYNHFVDKALMTMKPSSDNFIALQIYDATIRRRLSTFLITREKLAAVAEGTTLSILDSDLNNTLRIYRSGNDLLKFVLYYVRHEDSIGRFEGLAERFVLPVSDILQVLVCDHEVTRIIRKNQPLEQARIEIGFNAHRRIKEICKDPIEKRALSKAFRDHFMYGKDEEVFITDDFDGFFFELIGSYNGGLIRHEGKAMGRDGKLHPCIRYEIHT